MTERSHLAGKVAVVTGAGRGLGRAYAHALAAAGAQVVVNDLDEDAAAAVADELAANEGQAVSAPGAVGSTAVAEQLVEAAVAAFGRLDIMVTNAGALRDRTVDRMDDEDFDLVVTSHLRGTFTCGRAAIQRFRAQGEGGRLILVGSPAGQRGSFGQTAYSAAKAAIVGMGRTWAVECERFEVTVNAIVPTALTRMVATIPGLSEAVEASERGEPVPGRLRRRGFGPPADAAPLVVYLASDQARNVTGQAIGIGGDRLVLWSHPDEQLAAWREGGWEPDEIASFFEEVAHTRLQDFRSLARRS